jgi:CHAT domain-containing protein
LERYQLSPFNTEKTVVGIRMALGEIHSDVLAYLPDAVGPPTLDALCERLTTSSYTLLHLACHGQYIPAIDDTVVYLSKDDQQVDPVVSSRLLDRLSQIRGECGLPHFAFLATCESASPQAEGAPGGLAQRLVRDLGIPAVLAMTDAVTISTAEALTSTFY